MYRICLTVTGSYQTCIIQCIIQRPFHIRPGTFPAKLSQPCNKQRVLSGVMGASSTAMSKTIVHTPSRPTTQTCKQSPNRPKVLNVVSDVTFKDVPFVKSTLRTNLVWWTEHASSYIVDIVESGYIIPFDEYPPRSSAKNNRSASDNVEFVDKTILTLLESGVLKELDHIPHVVNSLTVASNSPTKLRLVLT